MIRVEVRRTKEGRLEELKQLLRAEARAVVIKHALGGAQSAYDVYPVGPESAHKDGSPHTRDTFTVSVDGAVIAQEGQFWNAGALATESAGDSFEVALRTAGASFYLEFGTIFISPMPLLRTVVKQARAAIYNELRQINLRA